MKILKKYILGEFSKAFLFGLFLFSLIFLISEFFFRLSDFIGNKASFVFIFRYLFIHVPLWVRDIMPIAVLVGILFSLNRISHDGEITAVKSCGINLYDLLSPIIFASLIFVIIGFLLNIKIVPKVYELTANMRENQLYNRKDEKTTIYNNIVFHVSDGSLVTIGSFDVENKTMKDITIDTFNNKFSLIKQIKAQEMTFNDKTWLLYGVIERNFTANGKDLISENKFPGQILFIKEIPEDFIPRKERIEEMSLGELKNEIHKLKKSGQSAIKEIVAYNMAFAYPFSSMVVVFLGISLALGLSGKFVKLRGIGYVLLLSFLYWSLISFGKVLGEKNVMPAFICVWFSNILFLLAGAFLFAKISK